MPLIVFIFKELKGSVKELNKFHIYETEKITRKEPNNSIYSAVSLALRVIFPVS